MGVHENGKTEERKAEYVAFESYFSPAHALDLRRRRSRKRRVVPDFLVGRCFPRVYSTTMAAVLDDRPHGGDRGRILTGTGTAED